MGWSTTFQHIGDHFGGRVRLFRLPRHSDDRGTLIPVNPPHLPFLVARGFIIDRVPPGTCRGGHAHRTSRQFLVAPTGRVRVDMLFSRRRRQLFSAPRATPFSSSPASGQAKLISTRRRDWSSSSMRTTSRIPIWTASRAGAHENFPPIRATPRARC
ncbi:MAG: hypothetical protein F9K19_06970 [Rhizobiaceae bacterium]|nr:MAG: hypothetical protein F9K19_06970 [Rhizobiaceae bacterium]